MVEALVSQDDFFLGKCFEAMEVDSLPSSHPVSTHVENPMQIQEIFDDVSYDKVRTCGLGYRKPFNKPVNALIALPVFSGSVYSEYVAGLCDSRGV